MKGYKNLIIWGVYQFADLPELGWSTMDHTNSTRNLLQFIYYGLGVVRQGPQGPRVGMLPIINDLTVQSYFHEIKFSFNPYFNLVLGPSCFGNYRQNDFELK